MDIKIIISTFAGKKVELFEKDNPDWVPSVDMISKTKKVQEELSYNLMSPEFSRFKRRQQRGERKKDCEAAKSLLLLQEEQVEVYDHEEPAETGTVTQTDLTGELIQSMTIELQNLRTKSIELAFELKNKSNTYDKSDFESKDEKVLYYTGLPTYKILLTLFSYLEAFLIPKKSMNKFQMLVLALMRLRLN